jgi:rubrerythrin
MCSRYNIVKKSHKLLLALIEMRDLEALIAKETTDAAEQVNFSSAKEVFNRWAQESDKHRKILQQIIDELQRKTLTEDCRICMEDTLTMSYCIKRTHELLKFGKRSLGIKELYALAKKHLMIEGDVEGRYAQLSEMTDDEEIKSKLIKLSENERKHHWEAQKLVDVIEKNYSKIFKEI